MPKTILTFFGPPGSGKGTQADMLGQDLKLPVISPGELLRSERDRGTVLGRKVAARLDRGKLVPNALIERLLDKRLAMRDCAAGYILDGYPRQATQLRGLLKRLHRTLKPAERFFAVYVDVSDRTVKERITGRRVCDCGASYHLKYNPPKKTDRCDLCGAKPYRRPDDAPLIVRERLHHFHTHMKPLFKYFQKHGELVRINGELDIKKVRQQIRLELKKHGVK